MPLDTKMKIETNGNRTHEPSLRELTVDLDGVKELLLDKVENLKDIINERDKLYKERYESQEKAIGKAEESQKVYNQGHNDLTRKMEMQYSVMVPQAEAQLKWSAIDKAIDENRLQIADSRSDRHKEINDLRTEVMLSVNNLQLSRGVAEGSSQGLRSGWGILLGAVGFILTILLIVNLIFSMKKG